MHRVVAEEMNGKKLTRDIDVHHEDHNKLNWDIDNLHMLGKAQHAWWSAIQHWYVPRVIAAREREQWEEFVGGGLS